MRTLKRASEKDTVSSDLRKVNRRIQLNRQPETTVTDTHQEPSSSEAWTSRLIKSLVDVCNQPLNSSLLSVLSVIGELTTADKALIFQSSDDGNFLNRTHFWYRTDSERQTGSVEQVPSATVRWVLAALEDHGVLVIDSVSKLPDDAFAIKAILESRGARAILCAPITINNSIRAIIGCVKTADTSAWKVRDQEIVKIVAASLSSRPELFGNPPTSITLSAYPCTEVLQLSPDSYLIANPDGSPVWVNEACRKLFGLSPDIDLAKFNILLDPVVHELGQYEKIERVFHDGESLKVCLDVSKFDRDTGLLGRSGAEMLELVLYPLRDSGGKFAGVVAGHRDVTGFEEQLSYLRTAEERFRLIFSSSQDMMIIAEPEGKVLMANPSCVAFLGFYPSGLQDFLKRIHSDDRDAARASLESRPDKTDPVAGVQYRCENVDGALIYLESSMVQISLHGQEYNFIQTRDITQRKLIEQELQATNDKLAREEQVLEEKNSALREILRQIGDEKEQIKLQIQSNVDRLIVPVLQSLYERADVTEKSYLHFLESCLNDITSPFVNRLEKLYTKLSPREIEICRMIKNGFSSKDIAGTLNISLLTVHKFRQQIRSKLGVNNQQVNLVNHLNSLKD